MAFWNLRRDLDSLFSSPFITLQDPWEDYNELRRRAMDLFDTHVPEECEQEKEEPSSSGEPSAIQKREKDSQIAPMKRFKSWIPRCDMHETENEVVISAEVPGMSKENINIDYDEESNIITLSGERKNEKKEEKETDKGKYHYSERSYGSFTRSFRLPPECKSKMSECSAKAADGVLEIICPKEKPQPKAEPKRRQITIN
ncbi:putative heat shock protein 20 [Monocercomonoides exilis]|uniref:putative heat shock protein 20 n=1 Tax=Monocercomonoides exilis TaxID=2049356 RepID=UPI003559A222|nr:putative heat shock protein 20 [Monocercomonoides exilis]|eukprot:MONOS_1155.1-p1 / transcript=MONOS_1155.1 / gene=MONOS_1155 / organism=Monocercomonoides_exilis_PA203 / gene_product=heat shock protein 20 / transcript_product=heat shock protein 20 / location=Mono_scaffold00019:205229-205828(+) / protein_length=200 / sequence_SO=supercontig / SO=protein_coding / is_pseudo=false